MEMREYKVSGYTRVVRRRAFTKWVNIHLNERFLAVKDLVDLADCFVTIQLLEIITKRNFTIRYCGQQPVRIKRKDGWRNIALFLNTEDFPTGISEEGKIISVAGFTFCPVDLFVRNCFNIIKFYLEGFNKLEIYPYLIMTVFFYSNYITIISQIMS